MYLYVDGGAVTCLKAALTLLVVEVLAGMVGRADEAAWLLIPASRADVVRAGFDHCNNRTDCGKFYVFCDCSRGILP